MLIFSDPSLKLFSDVMFFCGKACTVSALKSVQQSLKSDVLKLLTNFNRLSNTTPVFELC